MKKLLYIFLLVFGISSSGFGQGILTQFQLEIFDPLPSISFANLVVSNGLSATQPVFKVLMNNGVQVKLEGTMFWKDINSNTEVELAYFRTRAFSSRTILSNQLGTGDLRVENDRINQTAIDANTAKGKPIGTYRLVLWILDPNTNAPLPALGFQNPQDKSLTFYNPSQTITITSPSPGSTENPTDVIVNWTSVIGAQHYLIKVNNRKTPSQNLEAILTSENPLVNNRNVGLATSVSLRSILEREWTPGDEIVVRVSAYVPGPSGGFNLESQIINFNLSAPNSVQTNSQITALTSIFASLPPNMVTNIMAIINSIQGTLTISGFQSGDGTFMSQAQLTTILQMLQANPSLVQSIILNTNSNN